MILLISIHDAAAAWAAAVIDEEQAANAWPALEREPDMSYRSFMRIAFYGMIADGKPLAD